MFGQPAPYCAGCPYRFTYSLFGRGGVVLLLLGFGVLLADGEVAAVDGALELGPLLALGGCVLGAVGHKLVEGYQAGLELTTAVGGREAVAERLLIGFQVAPVAAEGIGADRQVIDEGLNG